MIRSLSRGFLLLGIVCLLGCGDDEVEVNADETRIDADSGTTVRASLSGAGETTVRFTTTGGAVGFVGSEREAEMTSSVGRADMPFDCLGEAGTHTVTATFVDDGLSGSVDIECVGVSN